VCGKELEKCDYVRNRLGQMCKGLYLVCVHTPKARTVAAEEVAHLLLDPLKPKQGKIREEGKAQEEQV